MLSGEVGGSPEPGCSTVVKSWPRSEEGCGSLTLLGQGGSVNLTGKIPVGSGHGLQQCSPEGRAASRLVTLVGAQEDVLFHLWVFCGNLAALCRLCRGFGAQGKALSCLFPQGGGQVAPP